MNNLVKLTKLEWCSGGCSENFCHLAMHASIHHHQHIFERIALDPFVWVHSEPMTSLHDVIVEFRALSWFTEWRMATIKIASSTRATMIRKTMWTSSSEMNDCRLSLSQRLSSQGNIFRTNSLKNHFWYGSCYNFAATKQQQLKLSCLCTINHQARLSQEP